MYDGLPAGQTWTASSQRVRTCFVKFIHATLGFHTEDGEWHWITCAPYAPARLSGKWNPIYSVLMNGDDRCCVLSVDEIQKCPAVETGFPTWWREYNDKMNLNSR